MATPFDPQIMPGADQRAQALASVANAIAQAKMLKAYAQLQHMQLDMARLAIQPVKPGEADSSGSTALTRQYYDLKTVEETTGGYLEDLLGWQRGERQQSQPVPFKDPPVEVLRYVQSIRDGVPYVAPTHTG